MHVSRQFLSVFCPSGAIHSIVQLRHLCLYDNSVSYLLLTSIYRNTTYFGCHLDVFCLFLVIPLGALMTLTPLLSAPRKNAASPLTSCSCGRFRFLPAPAPASSP